MPSLDSTMEFAPTQTKPAFAGCDLREIGRMEFASTQTKPAFAGYEFSPRRRTWFV
jgi:hypothetical protein